MTRPLPRGAEEGRRALPPAAGAPSRRRLRVALGLGLAAAAALALGNRDGESARPAAPSAARAALPAGPRDAHAASPARAARRPPEPRAERGERVVEATLAGALFAPHSWYVAPPPPPPAKPPPPAPPPPPTAPPLPFAFLGSYAAADGAPVFFLTRDERVIDVHVGDQLDGVYQLESADEARLVFLYLPLHIRQNLATSVPR